MSEEQPLSLSYLKSLLEHHPKVSDVDELPNNIAKFTLNVSEAMKFITRFTRRRQALFWQEKEDKIIIYALSQNIIITVVEDLE